MQSVKKKSPAKVEVESVFGQIKGDWSFPVDKQKSWTENAMFSAHFLF